MKLVMLCTTADRRGFKDNSILPVTEYESRKALRKAFMKLAIKYYKKMSYNYGRGAYFTFLGKRFEACDYYHIFSDRTTLKSPPRIYKLDEWFDKYIYKEKQQERGR